MTSRRSCLHVGTEPETSYSLLPLHHEASLIQITFRNTVDIYIKINGSYLFIYDSDFARNLMNILKVGQHFSKCYPYLI